MHYVYAALVSLFIVIIVLFSLQNLSNVTISLLTMSATLPVALLVVLAYVSGMVTGGSVLALLRSWFRSASKK